MICNYQDKDMQSDTNDYVLCQLYDSFSIALLWQKTWVNTRYHFWKRLYTDHFWKGLYTVPFLEAFIHGTISGRVYTRYHFWKGLYTVPFLEAFIHGTISGSVYTRYHFWKGLYTVPFLERWLLKRYDTICDMFTRAYTLQFCLLLCYA